MVMRLREVCQAKTGGNGKEVYGFLKKERGRHLKGGREHFLEDFVYGDGHLSYESKFTGSLHDILEVEEITHEGDLVGRQISAGHLKN